MALRLLNPKCSCMALDNLNKGRIWHGRKGICSK
jgi:hypothetical protein